MTNQEFEHMKQTINELCGAVLRLQIDLNSKPDLRDQFAMAALTGIVVIRKKWDLKDLAAEAYDIADAMMEDRE